MCSADIFLGLIALLFPPLPVWVKRGICSADSIINILLCVLGYIPGLIHAWYIIAKYPEPAYDYESLAQEDGRVTYVFVHGSGNNQQQQHCHHHQQQPKQPKSTLPHGGMTYGTTNNNASASAPAPAQPPRTQGNSGEGSSDGAVPPTYAEAVSGDHKVQTRD